MSKPLINMNVRVSPDAYKILRGVYGKNTSKAVRYLIDVHVGLPTEEVPTKIGEMGKGLKVE